MSDIETLVNKAVTNAVSTTSTTLELLQRLKSLSEDKQSLIKKVEITTADITASLQESLSRLHQD